MYSTCTINKKENEDIREFILKNFKFEPVDISEYVPESVYNFEENRGNVRNGYIQLLPGVTESDGFFVSIYKKKA